MRPSEAQIGHKALPSGPISNVSALPEPFLKGSDENQHRGCSPPRRCARSARIRTSVSCSRSHRLTARSDSSQHARWRSTLPRGGAYAWGVKRTKLKETLDEKPQEVARLSPQQDTGRLHQLERESASEPEGRGGSEKSACSPEGRGVLGREPRSREHLIRFPYSQGSPTTIPTGFSFIKGRHNRDWPVRDRPGR